MVRFPNLYLWRTAKLAFWLEIRIIFPHRSISVAMKFIPLLVAFYVAFVHSVSDSDPNYVTVCDAFSERFGCDPKFWYKGDRTQCLNTTQLMSWTSKPVRTNCFQLSAGDETNPVTSYIPGELLMINIRVTCYKYWYRGIMLVHSINGFILFLT